MEVASCSNASQAVTFQGLNWTGAPVTVSVQPVQLPAAPSSFSAPTIPGSATPIGVPGVAAAVISR
jgi:hypothetical protein